MAVVARLREERASEVEMMWSDDGMVFRLPESDEPPDVSLFLPPADEVEDVLVRALAALSIAVV